MSRSAASHLHFVQSLESLYGGGLGTAALGLHLELRKTARSTLVATRDEHFASAWPDALQCVRHGPAKAFFAPEVSHLARQAVAQAEVVHGHGLYVYLNWVFGREARRQRKPLVYHVHGFFDPWILARSPFKKKVAHWLFENANFRQVALWRALTDKEAEQIRACGIRQPIVVAPNGVDLSDLEQQAVIPAGWPHALRTRPRRLLFLGRIHPKKGLDLLIGAWSTLAPAFPDWELIIVGPDEGQHQAQVQQWIDAAHLTARILPAVQGAAKHAVIRSADLFVLPSYSEGFPVAVVEAAAQQRAVVMTRECNFPELGAVGGAWICDPTMESLRESLERAMGASDEERQQRGAAGRTLVGQRYTWTAIARTLQGACENLCN